MKKITLTLTFLFVTGALMAQVPHTVMRHVFDEVKTPYKYGLVLAPEDNFHKIDCPTVFSWKDKWYMSYIVYTGENTRDGGYQTKLAVSDDLLHWTPAVTVLPEGGTTWDSAQKAGYMALVDNTWGGSYEPSKYKGRWWLSYFGGDARGYEHTPLSIGMAWSRGDFLKSGAWHSSPSPVLSSSDLDAQWWEKLVQYKSTVFEDEDRRFGKRFVMFYNAGGVNPANSLKAERIGIALSDDLKHWERYGENPVFASEQSGTISGDAYLQRMGDLWVMFYFGAFRSDRPYKAFNTFACSYDLVNWTRWEGDDLIFPTKEYDSKFAHKSCVIEHDGIVYHFYCAVNDADQRGIALATSRRMGRSKLDFPEKASSMSPRTEINLEGKWRTCMTAEASSVTTDTVEVTIPHNWDDYYGYRNLLHGNLHGNAYYSKTFTLNEIDRAKSYHINFEGVGTYARVVLNGSDMGRHIFGRTCLELDVTQAVSAGENLLELYVEHPSLITDVPWICGGCSSEWGFSEGSQPFGIFRPVSMIVTDKLRIEPFGVHIWNDDKAREVFIETEIKNYGSSEQQAIVESRVLNSDGNTVIRLRDTIRLEAGKSMTVHQSYIPKNPKLWSDESPYLYTVQSNLWREGKNTDRVESTFGIRTISFPAKRADSDPRLYINGKPEYLNGVCEYEHLLGASHSFTREQILSRVAQVRSLGFNAFRDAHQPHNLLYSQLWDKYGIYCWTQFSAHVWYDSPQFRANFKELLTRWVKERRNSPAVIMWGLQNESVLPEDFAKECCELIRSLDPSAQNMRVITTCNGGTGTDWNVIQNWSGTYGGNPSRYASELKGPTQLLNGEYGAWRTLDFHSAAKGVPNKAPYSEERFADLLELKVNQAESVKDSVVGQFQWCLTSHDNPGRRQPDEALRRIDKIGPVNYKGILTPWEEPTEAYYMYRAHFADPESDPVSYQGPYRYYTNLPDSLASSSLAVDTTPITTSVDNILKPTNQLRYLYRLNCGGDEYTDSFGNVWAQDNLSHSTSWASDFPALNPYTGSQRVVPFSITGTVDQSLFAHYRYGRHKLFFSFDVPATESEAYTVELFFAEPFIGVSAPLQDCEGWRIFDVAVNNNTLIDDLDLWSEYGPCNAAKISVKCSAPDGRIVISFPDTKVSQAVISAIAIADSGSNSGAGQNELSAIAVPAEFDETKWVENFSWEKMEADTASVTPTSELPTDVLTRPSTVYPAKEASVSGEWMPFNFKRIPGIIASAPQASVSWTYKVGLAQIYAFRFNYMSEVEVHADITLLDSSGAVLFSRPITFPAAAKWKIISTDSGSFINAGTYTIIIRSDEIKGLAFQSLEVQ